MSVLGVLVVPWVLRVLVLRVLVLRVLVVLTVLFLRGARGFGAAFFAGLGVFVVFGVFGAVDFFAINL